MKCMNCGGSMMADGGEMEMSPEEKRQAGIDSLKKAFKTPMSEGGDVVDSIMSKRYSMGGRVANDTGMGASADLEDNQFDDLVKRDDLEASYTGASSGDEDGNSSMDEDDRDVVSAVMKSRKKKDRLPNPR